MSESKHNDHILFEILTSSPSSRTARIAVLQKAVIFPEITDRAFELFSSFIAPHRAIRKPFISLTDSELSYNVRALKTAIAEHFASLSAQTFSRESIIKIYGKNIPFSPNTQLYKENHDKLKVSDLLEITGYALEGAKQFCDMETSKLEEGLLVIKSIDLALNNKPYNRPDFKAVNLALDIFSSLAQKMESDPEVRKHISGGMKAVQLAIKFFKRD